MEKDAYILDIENKGLREELRKQVEEIEKLKKYKDYYEEQMR